MSSKNGEEVNPSMAIFYPDLYEQNSTFSSPPPTMVNNTSAGILGSPWTKESKKHTSFVWNFFRPTAEGGSSGICNICGQIIKMKNGSTSGLIGHLKNMHSITRQNHVVKGSDLLINMRNSEAISRLMTETNMNFHQLASSSILRALSAVSNITIDSHPAMIKREMLQEFELRKKALKTTLENLKYEGKRFSLTVNESTLIRNKRYLSVNVHVNNHVHSLGVASLPKVAHAETIVDKLAERLSEFSICLHQDVVAVSTNGEGKMNDIMITPLRQLCISHCVHLCVRDLLYDEVKPGAYHMSNYDDGEESDAEDSNEVDTSPVRDSIFSNWNLKPRYRDIVDKLKKLVRFCLNSTLLNEPTTVENAFNKKDYLLLNDHSKWHLLARTIKKVLQNEEQVKTALVSSSMRFPFTQQEISNLHELCDALEVLDNLSLRAEMKESNLMFVDNLTQYALEALLEKGTTMSLQLHEKVTQLYKKRRNTPLIHLMTFLEQPEFLNLVEDDMGYAINKETMVAMADSLVKRLFKEKTKQFSSDSLTKPEDAAALEIPNCSTSFDEMFEVWLKQKNKRARLARESYGTKTLVDQYIFTKVRPDILSHLYDTLINIPPTTIECETAFSELKRIADNGPMGDTSLNGLCFLGRYYRDHLPFKNDAS